MNLRHHGRWQVEAHDQLRRKETLERKRKDTRELRSLSMAEESDSPFSCSFERASDSRLVLLMLSIRMLGAVDQ